MSARRAATVLVLRPAADEATVEVLLVRRHSRASFMANAYVFPGGAVDDVDRAGGGVGEDPEAADDAACRRAALRELAEEVGLVLPAALAADPGALPRFCRWLTPSAETRRFDTDFFLVALPPDQQPVVDAREVFDLRWLTPQAALAEAEAGKLRLPPPTHATLWALQQELRRAAGSTGPALVAAVLRAAAGRATPRITPRLWMSATAQPEPVVVLPWAPEFPGVPGEGEPLPPPQSAAPGDDPPLRYRLGEGGFLPER